MVMMKMNNSPEEILGLIKSSSKIGVISHKNPDGDNIGSTISMILGIRENLDKSIFGIKVDEFPKNFRYSCKYKRSFRTGFRFVNIC